MIFDIFKKKEKTIKYEKTKKYTFEGVRKVNPLAYEKWREFEDNILKNYWNDKSNKKRRSAKIQELSDKLERSKGAINSRIKKLGLD